MFNKIKVSELQKELKNKNIEIADLEKKVKDLKLTKRLENGKLQKENNRLESKLGILESKLEDADETINYLKKLDHDVEKVEKEKKTLRLDRIDLEDFETELSRKEDRINKKLAIIQQEENYSYKNGYSDGLADGLRKAHDITREDRKYMTMIAMSTNQSKAIESSVKAINSGIADGPKDE